MHHDSGFLDANCKIGYRQRKNPKYWVDPVRENPTTFQGGHTAVYLKEYPARLTCTLAPQPNPVEASIETLTDTIPEFLQYDVYLISSQGVDDAICKTPDPSTKDFIMQQTMLRCAPPCRQKAWLKLATYGFWVPQVITYHEVWTLVQTSGSEEGPRSGHCCWVYSYVDIVCVVCVDLVGGCSRSLFRARFWCWLPMSAMCSLSIQTAVPGLSETAYTHTIRFPSLPTAV